MQAHLTTQITAFRHNLQMVHVSPTVCDGTLWRLVSSNMKIRTLIYCGGPNNLFNMIATTGQRAIAIIALIGINGLFAFFPATIVCAFIRQLMWCQHQCGIN